MAAIMAAALRRAGTCELDLDRAGLAGLDARESESRSTAPRRPPSGSRCSRSCSRPPTVTLIAGSSGTSKCRLSRRRFVMPVTSQRPSSSGRIDDVASSRALRLESSSKIVSNTSSIVTMPIVSPNSLMTAATSRSCRWSSSSTAAAGGAPRHVDDRSGEAFEPLPRNRGEMLEGDRRRRCRRCRAR